MTDLEKITLIMTSVGTEQQAVEISEELIARRLATCINIVPCLRSIYRWKGKVCEDTEYLLLIKTPESQSLADLYFACDISWTENAEEPYSIEKSSNMVARIPHQEPCFPHD